MSRICYQVNLQNWFGGGEVFTSFLARALDELGVKTVLFVHPEARFWLQHLPESTQIVPITNEALASRLGSLRGGWAVFHTLAPQGALDALHRAAGTAAFIAHMPWDERDPAALRAYDLVIPVSRHVADTLSPIGPDRVYPEPLYGVSDLLGREGDGSGPLYRESEYDWDKRKLRDRLLAFVHPWLGRFRTPAAFSPRPGTTLGIVSRLTPIKQFPLLFRYLTPALARFPSFNLEIFGSGGYASVRDLRAALKPIGDRVRFWGLQRKVGAAYARIDYLMTGLPEKEALGLNVIEAQACGVPVLAVRGAPFTETVRANVTGLFYADPRNDQGEEFAVLLARLARHKFTIDRAAAAEHLRRFSGPGFKERVERLIEATRRRGLWTDV